MSFSTQVKEELLKQVALARHCRIAELAALTFFFGRMEKENGEDIFCFHTENEGILRKFFTLYKKTFNIEKGALTESGTTDYLIRGSEEIRTLLQALKMWDTSKHGMDKKSRISSLLYKTQCCRRALLRGIYLCCGSMSNPAKGYHLEFVCPNDEFAEMLIELLGGFEIEARLVQRTNHPVVYLKEGASIVTLLNVMEAHVSLMNLENERILKDIANHTNRLINCEVANSAKTIGAASDQISDIRLIEEKIGLSSLPEQLKEVAVLRLENKDMPLKELGEHLTPPLGKSGVNHRMRKISKIAEKLRGEV